MGDVNKPLNGTVNFYVNQSVIGASFFDQPSVSGEKDVGLASFGTGNVSGIVAGESQFLEFSRSLFNKPALTTLILAINRMAFTFLSLSKSRVWSSSVSRAVLMMSFHCPDSHWLRMLRTA